MLNKIKYFALVLSIIAIFMLPATSAEALDTITPSIGSNEELNGLRVFYINYNNFSVSFTAGNPVGTVTWEFSGQFADNNDNAIAAQDNVKTAGTVIDYDGITVDMTPVTGNTTTFTGSIPSKYYDTTFLVYLTAIDSNGSFPVSFYVKNSGNSESESGTESEGIENSTEGKNEKLHIGIIEAVQLEDDKLQKIADNIGIDKSELHLLTNEDFTTATPPEPTQSMRDEVASDGYEFAAKLNTINVKEDGWYVFKVTIPDDLVGANISDLKLYYAEDSDFNTSSEKVRIATPIDPICSVFELEDTLGLDTLPKKFLAAMFLSGSKSLTVYILRILLLLLGGCNVGIGIAGALVVGVVAVKFFRKRK